MSDAGTIRVAAEEASLPVLRKFIADTCSGHGIDEQTVGDLQLAVDEAATNLAWYAYPGDEEGTIELTVDVDPDRIRLVLTDHGPAFEPTDRPAPNLEAILAGDREPGGLGIHLIHRVMDRVGYESTRDGNHLTLVKYRRPGPQDAEKEE